MTYQLRPAGGGGFGCMGCLLILGVIIVLVIVISVVVAILYAIGLAIAAIYRFLFEPQHRPFGAMPISRWVDWYEHASFTAYTTLNMDLVSSPTRVLVGSVAISLIPTMGVAILLGSNSPILPLMGLMVGFMTAMHLTKPANHYFPLSTSGGVMMEEMLDIDDVYLLDEQPKGLIARVMGVLKGMRHG